MRFWAKRLKRNASVNPTRERTLGVAMGSPVLMVLAIDAESGPGTPQQLGAAHDRREIDSLRQTTNDRLRQLKSPRRTHSA